MHQDLSGFPLTTDSAAAAGHMSQAIRSFNHWALDLMDHLGAALAEDPDFPMAHALKGVVLAGGRNARFKPAVDAALVAAKAGAHAVSAHERCYIAALEHMAANRLTDAAAVYDAHLAANPTDLLAHRLIQQEYFWTGQSANMRAVAERAAPAWSDDVPDHSMFLSVRSFGNEEALQYEAAERFGRAALERDPSDVWGTHAVAHALVMQGRVADGIAWLEALTGNWAGKNQIVHHLWWHLCLFLLERGEHERILALYDQHVRNPDSPMVQAMPDAYIDIQNAAALLLRLELRGVDVGARWAALAEVGEGRIDNPNSPFTNAHAAMILAACGLDAKAEALIGSMREFAARDDGPLGQAMRLAAIPASQAAVAHRKGDHEAVLAHMMPARGELHRMGGSHAQRDIFFQILVDSCHRLDRAGEVATLLSEITGIGFAHVAERTLYADAAAIVH